MLALAAAAMMSWAGYRSVYPLPGDRFGEGWGVNIHFTRPQPGEMEALSKAFRWVRMDFAWSDIERNKRSYDFSAYDTLMANLVKFKIRPIFILDYGNDLYQSGSPTTDASRAAFCSFVTAAVKHFRHRGIVWEMWNEPNIGFWQPKPDVSQYAQLALAVGKTIRQNASDEWLIGPATSTFDWMFLQACFEAGLLDYWDAVSLHPYRNTPPETALADWQKLRNLIDAKAAKGRRIPMISGEWGYSTVGVDENTQALYAVRQYLSNLVGGAKLSIWYDWKEDGPDPKNWEHHFGATHMDFSPKPAYTAIAKMQSRLAGYTFAKRDDVGRDQDFVLEFHRGGQTEFVVWTLGGAHVVWLPTGHAANAGASPEILGPVNTSEIAARGARLGQF